MDLAMLIMVLLTLLCGDFEDRQNFKLSPSSSLVPGGSL